MLRTVCVMYLHIARSGLTKPLRPRHEFYFTSVRVTSVQKLQNMTSAKHFSEFTQLFLVYICRPTCVIILKVTRFYLNLERKATLRLHRFCLSIHVFHADWYNAFNVYRRELAPGTVSLTRDRAQGEDSKHWAYSTLY